VYVFVYLPSLQFLLLMLRLQQWLIVVFTLHFANGLLALLVNLFSPGVGVDLHPFSGT